MKGGRHIQLGSIASACALAVAASLVLTGCPLSDDYYIERQGPATEGNSNGSTGGTSGTSLTGGGSGGSTGTPGMTSSGGTSTEGSGGSRSTGGGSAIEPCTRSECADGWAVMAEPPEGFEAREKAAYAATDLRLFVWGGLDATGAPLDTGALYDPRTDSWEEVPVDANTPSPRHSATAVWTGSLLVVWGGVNGSTSFADGGIYDLQAKEWLPMSDAPTARGGAVGAWIESPERVAFWGGETESGELLEGIDFYHPGDDSWQSGDMAQDPGRLGNAAWAGGTLTFWVFGGLREGTQIAGGGSYYSMSSEAWVPVQGWPGSERWGAFGSIVGTHFYVWGGHDKNGAISTGARYPLGTQPLANWHRLTDKETAGAPEARFRSHRESGWSYTENNRMFVIAGLDSTDGYLKDGGVYEPPDRWEPIAAWPSEADHAYGAVVLIPNSELIVWGGRNGSSLTLEGLRYLHP